MEEPRECVRRRSGRRSGLASVHLAGVLAGLPVLVPGDVLLGRERGAGGLLFRLHGAEGCFGAEAGQAQDVHQKTHEGQREGEDADEESRGGSAPSPRLPSAGLQQERPTLDQDSNPQIHDRIHQQAFGHPEPRVTGRTVDFLRTGFSGL